MERKELRIKPYAMMGGKEKGLTFKAFVFYDEQTAREVTIHGNYDNWKRQIWDPLKMKSVFINYMFRSNIPYKITREQFMNMSFRNFPEVTITNELVRQEQH